jgi:hypothetical protein
MSTYKQAFINFLKTTYHPTAVGLAATNYCSHRSSTYRISCMPSARHFCKYKGRAGSGQGAASQDSGATINDR